MLAPLLALAANPALAHAIVVASEPKAQEVVTTPSLNIDIRFNSRIDAGRSRLLLLIPKSANSPSVILPLEGGETDALRATALNLENGSYELLWQTLSVDGHITRGVIPFEVKR
ncbi:MAG TPA: copper resistance CopC family protein [Methylocystis sp.]|nr:copper resistance CopC family protein [Methylocystis sp.]